MLRTLISAGAMSFALAASPVLSQSMAMPASSGAMTASDVGMSPMEGLSASDYVKMAADGDMFEIESSQLALRKAQRSDVKSFANMMIKDHTMTTKALKAALSNNDRKIAPPPMMLSSENAANLKLLEKAPRASFDTLYLTQQVTAHQKAWALHKGFATSGSDPALQQVAATAVPIVEQHLGAVKGMVPASMAQ